MNRACYLWYWLVVLSVLPQLNIAAQGSFPIATSQEVLKFEHLTRENGLPSNDVNKIFQDSYGFIWIGTRDGLVRYDGYELKLYNSLN